ncbi:hypothetical protein HanRHA438_Chr07g0310011 [Helianthus annuus]|nr:hypothetical protein HanRHA438_Chr07g0310011 [Helianthus annuus]
MFPLSFSIFLESSGSWEPQNPLDPPCSNDHRHVRPTGDSLSFKVFVFVYSILKASILCFTNIEYLS